MASGCQAKEGAVLAQDKPLAPGELVVEDTEARFYRAGPCPCG